MSNYNNIHITSLATLKPSPATSHHRALFTHHPLLHSWPLQFPKAAPIRWLALRLRFRNFCSAAKAIIKIYKNEKYKKKRIKITKNKCPKCLTNRCQRPEPNRFSRAASAGSRNCSTDLSWWQTRFSKLQLSCGQQLKLERSHFDSLWSYYTHLCSRL